MKVYNKLVESKKEPQNKNDIWFDGSVFKIYKEGNWIPITLTKEATERLIEYANSLYVYVIVDELPESGEDDKIYILRENIGGSSVKLEEYIWDNGWKFVDNFNSVTSATPDWNAQKGEAGYIDNKPFGFNITETYNYKRHEDEWVDGRIDIQMFSFSPNYDEEKGCYIFPDIEMTGRANGAVDVYYLGTLSFNLPTYTGYYDDSERWISAESQVDDNYEGLWLEGSDGGQSYYFLHLRLWVSQIDYDINVNVGHITRMAEKYLPDTVIKTTPQTLSDTDKNQALANLGIDPIVWKYMMNPCEISISEIQEDNINNVPEDIISIIFNDGIPNKNLLNLCVFKISFGATEYLAKPTYIEDNSSIHVDIPEITLWYEPYDNSIQVTL